MVYEADFPIPVHPGEVLQDMLDENEISQASLARHLGMDPSKVNEICRGRRGLSTEMAVMLSKTFNQSINLWLNLQKNWELSQLDLSDYDSIEPIELYG